MALLPEPVHTTVSKIYAKYESRDDGGHRPHLGASVIGRPCDRSLWFTFRWADAKKFDGRMLRLFQTGHLAEDRFIQDLIDIGVVVDGRQWRITDVGGHFGGSLDGAALNLPEAPKTWHVLEFKTHSAKSFADLTKKRVKEAKPEHWVQMNTYMGKTGMTRAMYMAVNKDTDELYCERVEFDQEVFDKTMARADRIIKMAEPPLKISEDPTWWQCKFCDFSDLCHGTTAPLVNCRTCAHATPEMDGEGRWTCAKHEADIGIANQRAGCEHHRYIPILLGNFAEYLGCEDGSNTQYRNKLTGNTFTNGDYNSAEIRACHDKTMIGEVGVDAFKTEFGARVTG